MYFEEEIVSRSEALGLNEPKEILPVTGGEFLCLTNQRVISTGYKVPAYEEAKTAHHYQRMSALTTHIQAINEVPVIAGYVLEDKKGHFSVNGGMTAYIDPKGEYHIGYHTDENIHALAQAGYRYDSQLSVVMAPDGVIVDNPEATTAYSEMVVRGIAKREAEETAKREAMQK